MKMTWLHMEFVLIFSPADGRAKLGRTAAKRLLTLALLTYPNLKKYKSQPPAPKIYLI